MVACLVCLKMYTDWTTTRPFWREYIAAHIIPCRSCYCWCCWMVCCERSSLVHTDLFCYSSLFFFLFSVFLYWNKAKNTIETHSFIHSTNKFSTQKRFILLRFPSTEYWYIHTHTNTLGVSFKDHTMNVTTTFERITWVGRDNFSYFV